MRKRNLEALSAELYNAISNWNAFTENDEGERLLTEEQVVEYADSLYHTMSENLFEQRLI